MTLRAPSNRIVLIFVFSLVSIQGITLRMMPIMFRTFGRTFGLDLGQEGQIQSFFFFGAMVALFCSGWITERLGVKNSGVALVALIGTGAIILGVSMDYTMARVGATLMGIGNQWVLAVYSAVIAVRFQHRRQKMFMLVMAVMVAAGSLGPVALGYLLTRVANWRSIFLTLGAFLGIGSLLFQRLLGRELDSITPPRKESLGARDLLLSPTLWMIGLLVILDNLASGNLHAWTPRLFQIRYGANEALAGLLLSVDMIGMLAGRILMGVLVAGKVSERILLSSCYATGMIAYSLLLLGPSYPVALGLMALQGVFLSAQAPSTYSLTTSKFPARAAVAVPMADAIGSLGGITGPTLLGWLAERLGGLGRVVWLIPCFGFSLAAVSLGWECYDRWVGNPTKANRKVPAAS